MQSTRTIYVDRSGKASHHQPLPAWAERKPRRMARELTARETVALSLLVIALSGWIVTAAQLFAR